MIIDFAKVYRGNYLENYHFTVALLKSGDEYEYIAGKSLIKEIEREQEFSVFTRSSIKALQAKVCLNLIQKTNPEFKLQEEYIAIACSSHTCSSEQLQVLTKFADEYKIDTNELLLGVHKNKYRTLTSKKEHNCAGKHILMNLTCKLLNLDQNYININHPINQSTIAEIKRLIGLPQTNKINYAIDGCGLPTFNLSLKQFCLLFNQISLNEEYQDVTSACHQFPSLLGGAKQFDTEIMQYSPKKFFAKGGADGIMAITNLETKETFILKVLDGNNVIKHISAEDLCKKIGWLNKTVQLNLKRTNTNSELKEVASLEP